MPGLVMTDIEVRFVDVAKFLKIFLMAVKP